MAPSLRPFFSFYGGKWRAAPHYPTPTHSTIVEPFAGSAGYSVRYPDRQVILVDRDPHIVGTWRYLINATESEILALPLKFDSTNELAVPQEAKWLIGWWLNKGAAAPCKRPGNWMRKSAFAGSWVTGGSGPNSWWGEVVRARIASQLHAIRHWKMIEGSYTESPEIAATWFIDPPYQQDGSHYRVRFKEFHPLSLWCQSRRGQTMVCENEGADWLPFSPFRSIKASAGKQKDGTQKSVEVLWRNDEIPFTDVT